MACPILSSSLGIGFVRRCSAICKEVTNKTVGAQRIKVILPIKAFHFFVCLLLLDGGLVATMDNCLYYQRTVS